MIDNEIHQGDCLEIVPELPRAHMIFMDPPDNLGQNYNGFKDKWETPGGYYKWLMRRAMLATNYGEITWLSIYYGHLAHVMQYCQAFITYESRLFLWRFTFGQHRKTDCGNGFRPILRFKNDDAPLYPEAIMVKSRRQELGDKRANPAGRVPDDVWEFPRVCGNYPERRKWHPNQHPEALIERIVRFSCKPGDTVIDMFAGTGTVNRVCRRLGVNCHGIEISPFCCEKIREEMEVVT